MTWSSAFYAGGIAEQGGGQVSAIGFTSGRHALRLRGALGLRWKAVPCSPVAACTAR